MKINERLIRKFGRRYPEGSYVFREGDASNEIYYLISGRVRVIKQTGRTTKILAEMGPGEYFGEMAALIDAPRTASAYVTEESIIAVIHEETFRRLLKESGDVSLIMLKELAFRLKKTNQALEESTRTRVRLAVLLYFFKEWPIASSRRPEEELAVLTDTEPDEIRQVLEGLSEEGVLEMHHGVVTDFSPDKAWQSVFASSQAST